ncbi:helix-turn-helix domain-containing protein [Variovorax saccharolyticus]|uniref:helix-turn-helix domain-containing protein n=1 Tax=Variovorax saccharolyticus TaxID=3053516 RepID=UPI00257725CA|nr:helix-turn-helix transcriptional regulator [Variovorax sp. J22R187]MDM0018005.1 helix-turn-helix transcriptional regulator [Variovorax sp. J22R187]
MLNVSLLKSKMTSLGLSQTALAENCGVSKEAVSNWLAEESMPRPGKLAVLAEKLGLSVDEVLLAEEPEPVVAFRMRNNRAVTGAAKDAGDEVGRHLRQLLPLTDSKTLFEPPHLRVPSLDESVIRETASAVRASLKLSATDVFSKEQLFELFHDFGAFLVPVFWGGNRDGHENAMSVYLPNSKSSWVVFNLGCRQDDFKYWLAHEYGHCLTLHKLQGDEGEEFAEKFAQHLLFPDELAAQALAGMRESAEPLAVANWFSGKYDISVVTVVKAADRIAEARGERVTGLATSRFYAAWKQSRRSAATAASLLFGTDTPTAAEYIVKSEEVFRTPVFRALGRWQKENGGRSPSFIASALNIGLADATELSHALWAISA